MRGWQAGILLALIVVLWCAAVCAQPELTAAQQAFAGGDFKSAKTEYFSLVAHDTKDGPAWLGLARCCARLEEWDEALSAFERAAELDALDPAAHTEYGDLLKRFDRLEDAIEQYKLALDADPATPAAANVKPKLDTAKSIAEKSAPASKPGAKPTLKKNPPAKAAAKPQAKPAAAQQPEEEPVIPAATTGTSSFREVPVDQTQPLPVLKDATYDLTAGATQQSNSAHVELLAPLDPGKDTRTDSGVVQAMHETKPAAGLQAGSGTTETAAAPAAPATPATPEELLTQARDAASAKRWTDAVTAFDLLAAQVTLAEDVRLEYANALLESGDTQRAEDEYNRLLHANPDSIDAKIGLAKVLGKNQQINEAMYLLDQIFADKKSYPKVQLARAYIYAANDYISEAIAMIGEVQGYDPENALAKEMLADYTQKLDASMGWDKPGPLPDDPNLRGEYLYNQGERERAKQDFEQVVRANPGDIHAWQRLANLYRWDEQWGDAITAYLRYLKLNPDDYDARLRYAQVLLSNGDVADARDELWSLITDPGTPVEVYNEALLSYAQALTAAGQPKDALTWYEQALRFDMHNTGARAGYASALAAAREYKKAQEQYLWILEEEPGSQAARIGLAQTYAWTGDLKNAINYYDQIDASSNYYSAALIGKSFAYLWAGKRDKAVALAGEASRIDPGHRDLPVLYQRLNEKPDPQLAAVWRQSHDSDDNDYTGTMTTLNIPLDARGTAIIMNYEDVALDNSKKGQTSSGSHTTLTLNLPVGDRTRLTGSVSKVDLSNNDGTKTDKWNYSAAARVALTDHLSVGGSYEDRTLYDTAELARNQVSVEEWAANADWLLGDGNTRIFGQYARGKMNDHNTRDSYTLRASRKAQWQDRGRIDYGLGYRTLDYSWDLNHGYWDPDNYRMLESYVDWTDASSHKIKFDASVGFGLQKNSGTKWSGVFRYAVGVRSSVYHNRINIRAGYSNSNAEDSAASVPGYQWKSWYLGADYAF